MPCGTKAEPSVRHAHKVGLPANRGKLEALSAMLPVWRAGLARTMNVLTHTLLAEGTLPRWVDAKGWDGGLSQRQWDSVTRQARAALDSWMALREDEFRHTVSRSTLDPELKHQLHLINLRHAWWEPGDDEAHRMARRIIKHLRKKVSFPDMRRCRTMSMDGKIAHVQPSHGGGFTHWAHVSTLTKGHPVWVPLDTHADLQNRLMDDKVRLANHLQLHAEPDGTMTTRLVTTQPKAPVRTQGDIIGLDWGMRSLFATSDGRLHGLTLFAWLEERDRELTALTKDLARSRIPCRQSRRYRSLNRRIREHVTNEVNRVLNIIADDTVKELVVEDLDFRHGGLSKRMNRLVTRAGRNAVKTKLARLEETRGITVTKVNPAYTSQQCDRCGHASPTNRPDQAHFRCACCGHTSQADIAASRNILARRSRKDGWQWIGRDTILDQLRKEHVQRCPDRSNCPARHMEYGSPTSTSPGPGDRGTVKADTRVKKHSGMKYH